MKMLSTTRLMMNQSKYGFASSSSNAACSGVHTATYD
eukprot:CAMPEP_0195635770 /NCGR_PEP_ID=MMETSP0815-20121206/23469_1 /TAXON_ID=97485 /ORGANISM="Prymnesium parvum, Strain Texoma1" /LENGTH=36 /DNA_ID= /DNA_START= /DNA_END= /DNA_ORIENTATION=